MIVRFWHYWNGSPVRIKLTEARPVTLYRRYGHEEGWSSECDTFELNGDTVYGQCETDGVDCDGRFQTFSEQSCRVDRLDAVAPSLPLGGNERGIARSDGVAYPEWERLSASQRDHSAEAMGY
jgi:hypothetical protein